MNDPLQIHCLREVGGLEMDYFALFEHGNLSAPICLMTRYELEDLISQAQGELEKCDAYNRRVEILGEIEKGEGR